MEGTGRLYLDPIPPRVGDMLPFMAPVATSPRQPAHVIPSRFGALVLTARFFAKVWEGRSQKAAECVFGLAGMAWPT